MWTVVRETDYSFWLETPQGEIFPADFLSRDSCETVCILLNRESKARIAANQEPIRIVLNDKPALTPGRSQPTKITKITLDGYAHPKDKPLTVAVRDEAPAPAKPDRFKITV